MGSEEKLKNYLGGGLIPFDRDGISLRHAMMGALQQQLPISAPPVQAVLGTGTLGQRRHVPDENDKMCAVLHRLGCPNEILKELKHSPGSGQIVLEIFNESVRGTSYSVHQFGRTFHFFSADHNHLETQRDKIDRQHGMRSVSVPLGDLNSRYNKCWGENNPWERYGTGELPLLERLRAEIKQFCGNILMKE